MRKEYHQERAGRHAVCFDVFTEGVEIVGIHSGRKWVDEVGDLNHRHVEEAAREDPDHDGEDIANHSNPLRVGSGNTVGAVVTRACSRRKLPFILLCDHAAREDW